MSDIQDLAKICGITPQALRIWCRNNDIKPIDGRYQLTDEQKSLAIGFYRKPKSERESGKGKQGKQNREKESDNFLLSHMMDEIDSLREQLKVKDEQISAKDAQISDLTRSLQTALDATKALGTSTAISAVADNQGALLAKEQPVYEAPSGDRAPLIKRLIDAFKG